MQGDVAKHIDDIDGEDSCAMHVRNKYPAASGATWYMNSSCWAEFGEQTIISSAHRTCRFLGSFCRNT